MKSEFKMIFSVKISVSIATRHTHSTDLKISPKRITRNYNLSKYCYKVQFNFTFCYSVQIRFCMDLRRVDNLSFFDYSSPFWFCQLNFIVHFPFLIKYYHILLILIVFRLGSDGRGATVSACADLTNQLQCC